MQNYCPKMVLKKVLFAAELIYRCICSELEFLSTFKSEQKLKQQKSYRD